MQKDSITFVIPAFHAACFIQSTISKIRKVFGREIEIIIVVNEPEGNTISVVKEISEKEKNTSYLYFGKKLGKGRAILEGFKRACGNIIGFIDADCPFSLRALKENINLLYLSKCDCIIFSKWKDCSFLKVQQGLSRKCLGRIFNFIVNKVFNLNFRDTQGGAKFIRKEVMDQIGYNFICEGFVFDVELLTWLSKKDKVVKEISIDFHAKNISTVNVIRDIFPIMKDLFKLIRLRSGK